MAGHFQQVVEPEDERPDEKGESFRDDRLTTYGAPFWYAYASNLLLTTANTVLFRYGDFVADEGGSELTLGLIVGVGMIGSLVMRMAQAVGIDTYGVRRIWLLSSVGMVVACLGHLLLTSVDTPSVYALRILYQTCIAGIFGASITFISQRFPVYRMAEMVGTLGTSGFLGMILGSILVDRLYGSGPVTHTGVSRMFVAAAVLGAASGIFAWVATNNLPAPRRRRRMPILWLVQRYNPGAVLVVSIAMGFGLGLAATFLRPFAASVGIHGIGAFFTVYAITAFIARLSIRRLPERIGIRAMILWGLAGLALNMYSYLVVRTGTELVVPAIAIGIAHAILFPSVVAGGSVHFPDRYRGLGTILMLTMFDLGNLVGAPTVGLILRIASLAGLPRYPAMFISVGTLFGLVGLWYGQASRSHAEHGFARQIDHGGPPLPDSEAGDSLV